MAAQVHGLLLTAHGGFLPHGPMGITAAIVTVIFSMTGAEVATIAAAESKNPERAVAKAANSVIADRPRRPVAVPDLDPLTLLRLMGVFSIRCS
jgi:amino acid transporter